ncbi:MAG: DNA-3-methyladenine glycosylase 2 family protein [Clostridiales bacterium]|nr:DNA-3-methyladenine glycosylase 2 family protein [Clostridiales bacterium]
MTTHTFMKDGTLQFFLPGFSLRETLFCGQSFSWTSVGDASSFPCEEVFLGVTSSRAVYAYQIDHTLMIENALPFPFTQEDFAFWFYYFCVDINYPALLALFSTFPPLERCIQSAPGLRVLRQPFFDTLLSFIISQNNHIPRITAITQRLCREHGPMLANGIYGFPTADTLSTKSLEDFASLRAGFRGKYLLDAAKKVADGTVSESALVSLNNDSAREHLKQIFGVGNKVADCVLLYGLGRLDIVPMDVWMKRVMDRLFPKGYPKEIANYEGIAQLFSFAWGRKHLSTKE